MSGLLTVDPGGRARTAMLPMQTPGLEWLRIADLRIDPAYQRPLDKHNWRRIEKIAAGFDWSLFSPLVVAELPVGAEGHPLYAIIDGQHRAHAAALRMMQVVPAMVVRLDRAGQARAFAAINGEVTKVTVFHILKAALAAGDAWAIAADEAVRAAGCRLAGYAVSAKERKPLVIYSPGLVRRTVEAGLSGDLTRALSALAQVTTAQTSNSWWSEAVLEPWLRLVVLTRDMSAAELADFAAAADLPTIISTILPAARARDPQFERLGRTAGGLAILQAALQRFRSTGKISSARGARHG